MKNLSSMVWVELRKAFRSRMPLWTALGSLFMPFGLAFLIFISKNPELSRQLGLISAKADLVAYSGTDWQAYLDLFDQFIAVGGFFFFVIAISWVFGREFADGTVKDLLAVPVRRGSILLGKFIVVLIWSIVLTLVMFVAGLAMGAVLHLPDGSSAILLAGSLRSLLTACLAMMIVLPFALFASLGRGYLLPISLAVLIVMLTNLVAIAGWGEYFPWAVPALYAQGDAALTPASYLLVVVTGLAGMYATYLWWKRADQSR